MAYSRGKLTKYKLMKKSTYLAGKMPKTRRFTTANFRSLLRKYKKVIVKPSRAYGGLGVISVSTRDRKNYKIHHGQTIKRVEGIRAAASYVKKKISRSSRQHLVQKKIALAKVSGRPFDIRVMVQRKKGGKWTVTGKLAKVAGRGYIVTNVRRSKGKVMPLSKAIRLSNIRGGSSVSSIMGRIDRVALKAVRHLRKYYAVHTVGLDIGLDRRGRVWIIEPNFNPDKTLFRKLKKKSSYRRIMAYYRKRR